MLEPDLAPAATDSALIATVHRRKSSSHRVLALALLSPAHLPNKDNLRKDIMDIDFVILFVLEIWITLWRFLKKLGINLPYDPAISLLNYTCTPMFIAAIFIRARIWKQSRYSLTGEWIKQLWYVYTVNFIWPQIGMNLSQL